MTEEKIGPTCLHKGEDIIYVEGDAVTAALEDGYITAQEASALKKESEKKEEPVQEEPIKNVTKKVVKK